MRLSHPVARGILGDQGLDLCPCTASWILNHCVTRDASKVVTCRQGTLLHLGQAWTGISAKNESPRVQNCASSASPQWLCAPTRHCQGDRVARLLSLQGDLHIAPRDSASSPASPRAALQTRKSPRCSVCSACISSEMETAGLSRAASAVSPSSLPPCSLQDLLHRTLWYQLPSHHRLPPPPLQTSHHFLRLSPLPESTLASGLPLASRP